MQQNGLSPLKQKRSSCQLLACKGELSQEEHDAFLAETIWRMDQMARRSWIWTSFVHAGEFERNDMVEQLCQNLSGYLFSKNGWANHKWYAWGETT